MSCKCKNYLISIGKPKNKIDCIAWLLLNVFGCKFCETCRDKPCNIKDGELCTDNIANYIREAVKEENTPTADVVEVVRCKDCKHWGGVTYGQMCRKYSGFETKVCTEKDHYCSYGERREERETG